MPLQSNPYLPSLVNWNHPQSKGLINWWLCVPGLMGGPRWYDIVGSSHGILTNMNTSGSGWRSTSRQGGFGHILFDGTNDWINIVTSTIIGGIGAKCTISLWAMYLSLPAARSGLFGQQHDQACISWRGDLGGSAALQFQVRDGVGSYFQGGTLIPVINKWYNIVLSIDASSAITIYVNGINTGSAGAMSNGLLVSVYPMTIGIGFGGFSNSYIDDVRIYNRALTSRDVSDLYHNSTIGNFGLLNQTKTTSKFFFNIYNQTTTNGLLANGIATNNFSYNPSTQASGILLSSSSITSFKFNIDQTPYSGVWSNGNSLIIKTSNNTPSGGAFANCYTVLNVNYKINIDSFGVFSNCYLDKISVISHYSMNGCVLAYDAKALVSVKKEFKYLNSFKIGDIVFAKSILENVYLQYRILDVSTQKFDSIYKIGIGWVKENDLLSYENYHSLRCKKLITKFVRC